MVIIYTWSRCGNYYTPGSNTDLYYYSVHFTPFLYFSHSSILQMERIHTYIIYHDPEDERRILIEGVNVTKIHDKLEALLRATASYIEYRIRTSDMAPSFNDDCLPSLSSWITLYSTYRCGLSNDNGKSISVIELFLRGHDKGKHRKESSDYYGATTAHSLMNPRQRRALEASGRDHKAIWDEISEAHWYNRSFM